MDKKQIKKDILMLELAKGLVKSPYTAGHNPQSDLVAMKMMRDLTDLLEKVSDKLDRVEAITAQPPKKGEDGYTPKKGVDYVDGKDYVITPKDYDEIASRVNVPVVEKIIEKREIVKEPVIIKETVKEINHDIDEEKIHQIVKKKKLKTEHIEGLEQRLKNLQILTGQKPYLHGGGISSIAAGSGVTIVDLGNGHFTISAGGANTQTEKVTAVQAGVDITLDLTTLAHTPTSIMFVTRQGQILTPTTDWLQTGMSITVYNADASEVFLVSYIYA